jgi:nucleotide-binding universal stress UspA family protein
MKQHGEKGHAKGEQGRRSNVIVVGVDGSSGSDAALRWALAEAKLRGVGLRVVRAYQVPQLALAGPVVGAPGVFPSAVADEELERLRSASRAEAERVVDEALARTGADASEAIEIESAAVEGPPAETLIEVARGAELLVVGSRGHGGFVGLLLGSVSQQCAQHPPCPLVIVPHPEEREGTS